MSDPVAQVARAVLYEGYILWPYRRSALKNRQRWTFGGVYPRAHSEGGHADDRWTIQTQCLLEGDAATRLDVTVRFLHVVERRLAEERGGQRREVDELALGAERLLAWDEAAEREMVAAGLTLAALEIGVALPVAVPAGAEEERIAAAADGRVGIVRRSWQALAGSVEVSAARLAPGLHRLTVRVRNTTPWTGGDREALQRRSFIATHAILRAAGAAFVSLTDPPAALRAAAGACVNEGTWPVLAGDAGDRSTLLSSPIILPDYPRVAPESPGDLFDAGEIDQLLILNVLALSDQEREEMRATDPRAREILQRCAALTPEQLRRLSGAVREFGYGLREG